MQFILNTCITIPWPRPFSVMGYLGQIGHTVPVEDRVGKAVKRVHKLSAAAKAVVGLTCKGAGNTPKNPRVRGDRNGWRGGYQVGGRSQYNGGQRDYYERPWYPPSNQFNGGMPRGGGNGGNGQRTCFICGSTGHMSKQCPKGASS